MTRQPSLLVTSLERRRVFFRSHTAYGIAIPWWIGRMMVHVREFQPTWSSYMRRIARSGVSDALLPKASIAGPHSRALSGCSSASTSVVKASPSTSRIDRESSSGSSSVSPVASMMRKRRARRNRSFISDVSEGFRAHTVFIAWVHWLMSSGKETGCNDFGSTDLLTAGAASSSAYSFDDADPLDGDRVELEPPLPPPPDEEPGVEIHDGFFLRLIKPDPTRFSEPVPPDDPRTSSPASSSARAAIALIFR
mmetsp:Transcript_1246/g.3875  ORF Transcript_1246/g.3875 Transcript_1246/m.3875 type:complete len:251 (+) Transcript_1246:385-1137(+)